MLGMSTSKTAKPTGSKELREPSYLTNHISSTKNKDSAKIQIQMKTEGVKPKMVATTKSSGSTAANKKIKFDQ